MITTTNPQRLSAKSRKREEKSTWIQSEHKACMYLYMHQALLFLKKCILYL